MAADVAHIQGQLAELQGAARTLANGARDAGGVGRHVTIRPYLLNQMVAVLDAQSVPDRVGLADRRGRLTPQQCVAIGGHCWRRGEVLTSDPPKYQERCKHCPATRRGVSREPWAWTYPEGQP
jgi:hypothetical protein